MNECDASFDLDVLRINETATDFFPSICMLKTLSQRHISWTHADFPVQHHSAPPSSSSFKASSPKSSGRPSESIAKTSELSEEVKSITPDKEHDVIMNEVEMGAAAAEGGTLLGEQQQNYRREGQNSGTGDHDIVMAEAKHGAGAGGSGKNGGDGASNAHHNGDHGSHNQQSGDSKVKSEEPTVAAQPSEATSDNNVPESNHLLYIGTLSYSEQEGSRRQHQIRGNWKYENSPASAIPQRFELIRAIPPDEDLKDLPKDGEYHGTFSLAFEFTTSREKKRQNERSGVKIKFTKEAEPGVFSVEGKGVNDYGTFELVGTATKSKMEDDPGYHVRLKKIYTVTTHPPAQQQQSSAESEKKKSGKKSSAIEAEPTEEATAVKPPPPTVPPPVNVVCLRGKLSRNTSENLSLGLGDVIHKITGIWAMGLNHILDDPDNTKALCNKFEYEHKCSGESTVFPLSGKYTGWFYVSAEDGSNTKTKIFERDVMLKFIENSEGYHNVEGKGSNIYGKYTISGTLDSEGIITLFRHFQPLKLKVSNKKSGETTVTTLTTTTPAPGLLNASRDKKAALPPIPPMEDLQLSFDDVEAPDGSELVPVVQAPLTYGAVSKGIFKITEDGHHSCSGNWAITFEQLSSGTTTSSCHFGILPHIAAEDAKTMLERMDKVGATDHDDRRINIPDRGGPTMLNNETFPIDSVRYRGSFKMRKGVSKSTTVRDDQIVLKFVKNTSGSYNVYGKGINNMGVYDIVGTLILQTSTSDPERSSGQRCPVDFAIPVDPVALGIPTYFEIIKNPMDLGTINSRLESGELDSPEEFIRLVRLVFENAVTFNTMPDSFVASTARSLLAFFNSKIRTVERVLDGSQKNKKLTKAELIEMKRKEKDAAKDSKKKGKRKGLDDGGNDSKRMRLNDYVEESKTLMEALSEAAPQSPDVPVSREEFNLLLRLIQLQNEHTVAIHKLVAKSSSLSGAGADTKNSSVAATTSNHVEDSRKSTTPPKKKKPKTEKQEKAKAKAPPSPQYSPDQSPVENLEPLTMEEQVALSDGINGLPEFLLPGAMQIIREADTVNDDDDEIDLDLDMLDIRTQRKLQRYINENCKPKRKKEKKRKSSAPAPVIAAPSPPPAPSPESEELPSTVKPRPSGKTFFSLGQDDSDSDSEPESSKHAAEAKADSAPAADPFADDDDIDDEEDEDDVLKVDDIAANWVANPSQAANPEDEGEEDSDNDEDDLWGAAKKEAEASKALEADRAKREEKMIAEANMAMQKRMEEAQALGEEVRAKREEEAAIEARRLEEQEREAEIARNAAREKALQEVNEVKNTIDLDAQRELMRQYEQEFNDNYSAGASPSSDFGF
eukprot:CCRYP_004216-RC/>CCRYP_004216-RC protein AED:0.23 eAED:0.23 QI:0/0.33/0.25/1/0.33/0.25/4/186/1344